MKFFKKKERFTQVPFHLLIINPIFALNEIQTKEIKEFFGSQSYKIDSEIKVQIVNEILTNISNLQSFSSKDYSEFTIGDCLAIILTADQTTKILPLLKSITEKIDQSKSELIKTLFKNKRIIFSGEILSSFKISNFLKIKTPVLEIGFEVDKNYLTVDQICKFLKPPDLDHPILVNRLDMFAVYGPSTDQHKINHCFCKKCEKVLQNTLQKSSITKFKKVAKTEIDNLISEICDNCKSHIQQFDHLFSGQESEHILTNKELNEMVYELNFNELLTTIFKVDKTFNKNLIKRWTFEGLVSDYSLNDIKSMLSILETDDFARFNFCDFQNLVLEDRQIRFNYMAGKLLNTPIHKVELSNKLKKFWIKGRNLPIDVVNNNRKRKQVQIDLGTNASLNLRSKMSPGELGSALDRIFHKYSHKVLSLDRIYPDTNKLRMSFLTLKSYD